MNNNQLKLEVHDFYRKDENRTKIFETSNDENLTNEAYLNEKFPEINGHLSLLEKDYNKFKLHYDKQTVGEILIQRAVKATIQKPYD